jgi:hypothetical protein
VDDGEWGVGNDDPDVGAVELHVCLRVRPGALDGEDQADAQALVKDEVARGE